MKNVIKIILNKYSPFKYHEENTSQFSPKNKQHNHFLHWYIMFSSTKAVYQNDFWSSVQYVIYSIWLKVLDQCCNITLDYSSWTFLCNWKMTSKTFIISENMLLKNGRYIIRSDFSSISQSTQEDAWLHEWYKTQIFWKVFYFFYFMIKLL